MCAPSPAGRRRSVATLGVRSCRWRRETAGDLVVSYTENVDPDRVRAARELEDTSVEVSETLRSATWERAQPPTRFRFEGGGRGLW